MCFSFSGHDFSFQNGIGFTCKHLSSASWALFWALLLAVDSEIKYNSRMPHLVLLSMSPDRKLFTLLLFLLSLTFYLPPSFYVISKYWILGYFSPPMTVLNLNTVQSLFRICVTCRQSHIQHDPVHYLGHKLRKATIVMRYLRSISNKQQHGVPKSCMDTGYLPSFASVQKGACDLVAIFNGWSFWQTRWHLLSFLRSYATLGLVKWWCPHCFV